jgi:hypothetical protein
MLMEFIPTLRKETGCQEPLQMCPAQISMDSINILPGAWAHKDFILPNIICITEDSLWRPNRLILFLCKTPPELSQLISSPIQPHFYTTFIYIPNVITLLILTLCLFIVNSVLCTHEMGDNAMSSSWGKFMQMRFNFNVNCDGIVYGNGIGNVFM